MILKLMKYTLVILSLVMTSLSCTRTEGRVYVCPPCSCAAHETGQIFHEDGSCSHCGMSLMEKMDTTISATPDLRTGSGNFLIEGGKGHAEDTVAVFYHMPENYTARSSVLLVIPGSGRDADEYRDSWIESSEKHGILVLSPMYLEQEYGFGDYHMGGVMEDPNITEPVVAYSDTSNEVALDEDQFTYSVNRDSAAWIFRDFDRIFGRAAEAAGSERDSYDLFGHSAGGQILHRLVLLSPNLKADRIVASNSGFYTLPDFEAPLPFGLEDVPMDESDLREAFGRELMLLIGEEDDEDETGGILLRSPSADRQGAHRLERARFFYRFSRDRAESLDVPFRWKLEIVPGVGHDFEKMGEAAARYLYGK